MPFAIPGASFCPAGWRLRGCHFPDRLPPRCNLHPSNRRCTIPVSTNMFPKPLLLLFGFLVCSSFAAAQASPPPANSAPTAAAAVGNRPISEENRVALIRGIQAEYINVKKPFPQGKEGLIFKNGAIHPSDQEIRKQIAMNGPAARPGDKSQITGFEFKDKNIVLEINGGPQKKRKWYQRISVAGMGGEAPVSPQSDQEANARGSVLIVQFDKFIPDMNVEQFKKYLEPIFDFKPLAGSEAYVESLPPKVKQALKEKRVLVGMNRDLVTLSKGRPDQKIREQDGDTEYEEWVSEPPPKDFEFVRFVGDGFIQDKIMKVGGKRVFRREREIKINQPTATAKPAATEPAKKPSMR